MSNALEDLKKHMKAGNNASALEMAERFKEWHIQHGLTNTQIDAFEKYWQEAGANHHALIHKLCGMAKSCNLLLGSGEGQ